MSKVTIKDVARRAGVSISTVSNVLNQSKYVSDDLQRKVLVAVRELDYVADPVARNMKAKNTKTIGVITVDISGLFYPYVLEGIYSVAEKMGYNVSVFGTNVARNLTTAYQKEKEGFVLFAGHKVDGIIFSSMIMEELEKSYAEEILKIATMYKRTSLVSIERDFTPYGISSVFSDSEQGSYMATKYLLSTGCKSIVHIAGQPTLKVSQDRIRGYKRALEESGQGVSDQQIVFGDYSHQSGYLRTKELLKQPLFFDGISVSNDQMAVGACRALKEQGIAIPADVKVIGYDDVFLCSEIDPPLSSVHVLKREMGEIAAKQLISQIESNLQEGEILPPKKKPLPTKLVVRRSTDSNALEDWIITDW